MMRANLRITANFDPVIAEQIRAATNQNNPALTTALIIDDVANVIHRIKIEYDNDDEGRIYRRLNYEMVSVASGKTVLNVQNRIAQELLYKIATALTGSTLCDLDVANNRYNNRNFDKGMFILGPNDGTWDDVLPGDKPKLKTKRKPATQKESKEVKKAKEGAE